MRHTRSFTVEFNSLQPYSTLNSSLSEFLAAVHCPTFLQASGPLLMETLGPEAPFSVILLVHSFVKAQLWCHHPWKPSLSTFPSSLFYFVRSPTAPSMHLYHSITHTPLWLSAYFSIFLTCHWAPWGQVLSLWLLYPWLLVATALLTGSTILNSMNLTLIICEAKIILLISLGFCGIKWENKLLLLALFCACSTECVERCSM